MWFAALAMIGLLIIDILGFFRRNRKTEKVIRRGDPLAVRNNRKRLAWKCLYAGCRLMCPACGCEFALTDKSKQREVEIADKDTFSLLLVDCPDCGSVGKFSTEEIYAELALEPEARSAVGEYVPPAEPISVDVGTEADELSEEEMEEEELEDNEEDPPKKDDEKPDIGGEGGVMK